MPLSLARMIRWTDFLIANPQLQGFNKLYNSDTGRMCCLGALCKVEGLNLDKDGVLFKNVLYAGRYEDRRSNETLYGDLETELGSDMGVFYLREMPDLGYENIEYKSAANANDNEVPWPVIAEHFREHYKCLEGITVNEYLKAKAMGTQQEQQK